MHEHDFRFRSGQAIARQSAHTEHAAHAADADGAVANTLLLGALSQFDIGDLVYNDVQNARDGEGAMTGSMV